uniref:Uncharacterized protein n=1 Tax=Tetraselmis sp. GSL018 TaxID=582737 RepID=A0A061SIE2_9CHLO
MGSQELCLPLSLSPPGGCTSSAPQGPPQDPPPSPPPIADSIGGGGWETSAGGETAAALGRMGRRGGGSLEQEARAVCPEGEEEPTGDSHLKAVHHTVRVSQRGSNIRALPEKPENCLDYLTGAARAQRRHIQVPPPLFDLQPFAPPFPGRQCLGTVSGSKPHLSKRSLSAKSLSLLPLIPSIFPLAPPPSPSALCALSLCSLCLILRRSPSYSPLCVLPSPSELIGFSSHRM